jgi:hypothetical protein
VGVQCASTFFRASINYSGIRTLKTFGLWLFVLGVVALAVAFGFDTTVETGFGPGRVHNIGLMNQKQNIMLLGVALTIVGAIFIGFGSRRTLQPEHHDATRTCPHCAEVIKKEAKVCRFCEREIERAPNDDELMKKFGILHDGLKYHYARHQYDKFEDALAHARREQTRG